MDQSPAARRTGLLHRMLLLRHLAEQLHQQPHDEAVEAGVLSALGPGDTLIPGPGSHLALLLGGPGLPAPAGVVAVHLTTPAAGSGVLFCPSSFPRRTAPCPAHAEVDSTDVEAIARTAAGDVASVRGGAAPCLLAVRAADHAVDPVEVLAERMRIDHQLDAGTLRAMERNARERVAALLAR